MGKISLLSLLTVVLTGCAAPAFVPPSGDDTVRLEVRSSLPAGVTMSLFTYENGLSCSSRQLLNGGAASAGASTSQVRLHSFDTRLKTDTVQTIDGFFGQGSFFCRIAVSFYPQKNKIYTARPGYGNGRCYVLIFDTTATVGGVLEKTLTKRVSGEPLVDGGNWCKPMAESVVRDKLNNASTSGDILEDVTGKPRPEGQERSKNADLDDLQGLLPSNK